MNSFSINFVGVKTVWYFYEAIIKGLEFPDWCGKNADAVWDLITGYLKYPSIIYVKGVKTLPKELNREVDLLLGIFNDINKEYPDGRFEIHFID